MISTRILLTSVTVVVLAGGSPPIRYAPRVVDPHFASRVRLCREALDSPGISTENASSLSIAELLGPGLVEVLVHQIGDSFPDFPAVEAHVTEILDSRPRAFFKYSPWAEGTPLDANGILGTLRHANGRAGRFEIAAQHVCVQDSMARTWWMRVGPLDVFP